MRGRIAEATRTAASTSAQAEIRRSMKHTLLLTAELDHFALAFSARAKVPSARCLRIVSGSAEAIPIGMTSAWLDWESAVAEERNEHP